MKANLARFTTAIALLATIALSLGAGMRWDLLVMAPLRAIAGRHSSGAIGPERTTQNDRRSGRSF